MIRISALIIPCQYSIRKTVYFLGLGCSYDYGYPLATGFIGSLENYNRHQRSARETYSEPEPIHRGWMQVKVAYSDRQNDREPNSFNRCVACLPVRNRTSIIVYRRGEGRDEVFVTSRFSIKGGERARYGNEVDAWITGSRTSARKSISRSLHWIPE